MARHDTMGVEIEALGFTHGDVEHLNYILHIHEPLEFVYILEGEVALTLEEKHYKLHPGDLCLVSPWMMHSYYTSNHSLVFSAGLQASLLHPYRALLLESHPETAIFKEGMYDPSVKQLIQALRCPSDFIRNPMGSLGCLQLIIGHLIASTRFIPNSARPSLTRRLLNYMMENRLEPLTQTRVAEALGVTPYQLSRLCNQQIGIGFAAYLKFVKIMTAKRQLAFTNKPVSEVSAYCGFENIRTFNRSFMEVVGDSPTGYRSRMRRHQQAQHFLDMSIDSANKAYASQRVRKP